MVAVAAVIPPAVQLRLSLPEMARLDFTEEELEAMASRIQSTPSAESSGGGGGGLKTVPMIDRNDVMAKLTIMSH